MARLAIAFLFAIASPVLAEPLHDTNGQLLVNGRVSSADAQSVVIQLTGKSTATIQFDDLSMADCASVRLRDKPDSEFRQSFRQWASANGSFHVNAKAVAYIDDKNVRLTRDDGKVVSVPLERLSKADQNYLDRLKNAVEPVAVAADDPFSSTESFNGSPAKPPTNLKTASEPSESTTTVKRYKTADGRLLTADEIGAKNNSSADVDRNPDNESVTEHTATGIPTFTGPRGGVYHYSPSGNKVYQSHGRK